MIKLFSSSIFQKNVIAGFDDICISRDIYIVKYNLMYKKLLTNQILKKNKLNLKKILIKNFNFSKNL